jgi:hypothetical protein
MITANAFTLVAPAARITGAKRELQRRVYDAGRALPQAILYTDTAETMEFGSF